MKREDLKSPKRTKQAIAPPLSERPTLTIDEFCKMVGVGRTTFYKAVAAGDLKPRKYGRRTLVTREEMLRFVNDMPQGKTAA
jgi:excisionase family DNA binding protein